MLILCKLTKFATKFAKLTNYNRNEWNMQSAYYYQFGPLEDANLHDGSVQHAGLCIDLCVRSVVHSASSLSPQARVPFLAMHWVHGFVSLSVKKVHKVGT